MIEPLRHSPTPVLPLVLPLENGDRLSRTEFEHRYNAMPHLKKAELIEGVVYLGPPVRVIHSQPHANLMLWLGIYQLNTPREEHLGLVMMVIAKVSQDSG